jgi:hypothetical protein
VGHAEDGGHRDVGVLREHLLDLAGVHVVAVADDHVLRAVDDGEVAVVVLGAEVAGAEPAVDDGRGRVVGTVQVAVHQVVAADDELADLAVG